MDKQGKFEKIVSGLDRGEFIKKLLALTGTYYFEKWGRLLKARQVTAGLARKVNQGEAAFTEEEKQRMGFMVKEEMRRLITEINESNVGLHVLFTDAFKKLTDYDLDLEEKSMLFKGWKIYEEWGL